MNDALPVPEWPGYLAKFIALMTAIASIQVVVMLVAICVQAVHGYTRFQLGLYIETLLGQDLLRFAFFATLAFLIHVLSPNKYVGLLRVHWRGRGQHVSVAPAACRHPDGALRQPARNDLFRFLRISALDEELELVCDVLDLVLFPALRPSLSCCGRAERICSGRRAWHNARLRFRGSVRVWTVASAMAFAAVAGWVYYNTEILNHVESENDGLQPPGRLREDLQALSASAPAARD